VVERHKDGYESDVEDSGDQLSDVESSSESAGEVPADRDSDRSGSLPSLLSQPVFFLQEKAGKATGKAKVLSESPGLIL